MNVKETTKKGSIRSVNYKWFFALLLLFALACSKDPKENPLPDLPPPVKEEERSIAAIDDEVGAFMARFNVPGVSLAVTKNGKLVYAKGYGYAEKEADTRTDTASLFRIASLSKFVTTVGLMKLIEQGRLTIDDKVFGNGSILGDEYGPYPGNVANITVKNLLHHTLGGWGNASSDPSFLNASYSLKDQVKWTIANRPLENVPGSTFAYSNMGFQIVGLIIEKLSGESYATYIQSKILKPAGIKNMQIAGGTLAERKANEVRYYGQNGGNPYGYGTGVISRLQGCGAWIASAKDLMRLMVRADGFGTVPDMLNASTIQLMTTPSNVSQYACGLRVNASNNWWHGGALTGSRTWLVRTSGGYCWAILTNTRDNTTDFTTALDRLVWAAVNNSSTKWPDVDLFK